MAKSHTVTFYINPQEIELYAGSPAPGGLAWSSDSPSQRRDENRRASFQRRRRGSTVLSHRREGLKLKVSQIASRDPSQLLKSRK